MANRRPLDDVTAELDGSESAISANSVASDFAALVAILERQMGLVSTDDYETRSHIAEAKAAAERGAALSRELLERIDPKG